VQHGLAGIDVIARDPAMLGDKLLLLYDGAAVSAQMDEGKSSVANAREVAELLLDKHLK